LPWRSTRRFACQSWYANVTPKIGGPGRFTPKELTPLLGCQLEMSRIGCVSNELVMATKHIFCRAYVFIETQKHSSLGFFFVAIMRFSVGALPCIHAAKFGRRLGRMRRRLGAVAGLRSFFIIVSSRLEDSISLYSQIIPWLG